jgi:hypothetical protein
VLQFLMRVWFAYAASNLRQWGHLMEAWSRALPSFARTLTDGVDAAGSDAEARAMLLDELRAHLRELTEYPSQESKRLQAELDRIAATMWTAPAAAADAPYWRRWEAKP